MAITVDSNAEELRSAVRRKYAAIAAGEKEGCCSTGSSCGCDSSAEISMVGDAYDSVEGYVETADLGLGCGIPTDHAGLEEGQTVVDLGSGAGLDAFVARRIVGERGRVIGVDFTPEMVTRARENAEKLGLTNVMFVEGEIEDLPLDSDSADVMLSNCVLNLVPEKERAFEEMYRVLRPAGHFCVSDIVSGGPLPDPIRRSAELYAGCVAGALNEKDYLEVILNAGFMDVKVHHRRRIEIPEHALPDDLSEADRTALAEGGLWSITVRGEKLFT